MFVHDMYVGVRICTCILFFLCWLIRYLSWSDSTLRKIGRIGTSWSRSNYSPFSVILHTLTLSCNIRTMYNNNNKITIILYIYTCPCSVYYIYIIHVHVHIICIGSVSNITSLGQAVSRLANWLGYVQYNVCIGGHQKKKKSWLN